MRLPTEHGKVGKSERTGRAQKKLEKVEKSEAANRAQKMMEIETYKEFEEQ